MRTEADPLVRLVHDRGELRVVDAAEAAELAEATARQRLDRLVERGWLSAFYRPAGRGKGTKWYKVAPSRRAQLGESERGRWAKRKAVA